MSGVDLSDIQQSFESAFPRPSVDLGMYGVENGSEGLTKREYIAIEFMKSWISKNGAYLDVAFKPENVKYIIDKADYFLHELNQSKK